MTICGFGNPDSPVSFERRDGCYRIKAGWVDGTSTSYVSCGIETDAAGWIGKPKSITVHN